MAAKQQQEDDLDLLLSLDHDRVIETPPSSPRYDSENENGSQRRGKVDMSVFHNAVEDCLDYTPENVVKSVQKSKQPKGSKEPEVEKFSGLRIRNQLVSTMELSNRLADIRFVRLQAIKNVLKGDTLSGCWATIGVLVENGITRKTSNGKDFCIWKVGCLDEDAISVFMFGDAYTNYSSEKAGTIFALFNSGVRADNKGQGQGQGFSLSVFSAGQILKMGTSTDYGVCNGKKQDGNRCTIAINKRRGTYCKYHNSKASEKYSVNLSEIRGGNLKTAFRNFRQPEGVYTVDPCADRKKTMNSKQPLKLLSVDCLKKALSNAGKVTTNIHSQGIRFLNQVTEKYGRQPTEGPHKLSKHEESDNRNHSKTKLDTSAHKSQQLNAKRRRVEHKQPQPEIAKAKEKMIELDFVSSDEEM